MKNTKEIATFNFWRGNLKANHFILTADELKDRYREWLRTKELSWIEYYGHQTVSVFITGKDGLNSTFDRDMVDRLESILMPIRHEFYPK